MNLSCICFSSVQTITVGSSRMCTNGSTELFSSPAGSVKLCVASVCFHLALFYFSSSFSLFNLLLNTRAEPNLTPPPPSRRAREGRQDRSMLKSQLNRSKEEFALVGSPLVHPSPQRGAPSVLLFHIIKQADTGPFCCTLIGYLLMWHR